MSRAPRITEHPGAGRIREQTLDEYLAALPEDHLAREQLAEIRAMALSGMKAINELVESNKKVRELEAHMADLESPKALPPLHTPTVIKSDPENKVTLPDMPPTPTAAELYANIGKHTGKAMAGKTYPRAICPYCTHKSVDVSTAPGPWAKHMQRFHMDQPFISPKDCPVYTPPPEDKSLP